MPVEASLTGAAIAGAEITAIDLDTKVFRTVQSNARGQYDIGFLPVGEYSINVIAPGFTPHV